ncbi:DUF3349 domain-containing protein [Miniimonas arenae]|uniref:DUF3349 domain-containing protein n=1 Tax=Miniimonas arenae TaxID=676201 RepID=A0A5C5BEJ9_9MICO|nr:DUF3349 domain-containing protein [Miniimonas arenae]TNU76257.1 DUF3349 domain-containing protein [Miniimonas arenae]
MNTPDPLRSVLRWLMAGYPDGVPPKDYSPVLALLRREQLTTAEIASIVEDLQRAHPADSPVPAHEPLPRAELVTLIEARLLEEPSEDEVARVAAILARHGWPSTVAPAEGDAPAQAADGAAPAEVAQDSEPSGAASTASPQVVAASSAPSGSASGAAPGAGDWPGAPA